jgi:hypothetical protein
LRHGRGRTMVSEVRTGPETSGMVGMTNEMY